MIYEALTSGARVGILPLSRRTGASRVVSGMETLVAEKDLTPFDRWLATQRLVAPPCALNEAERCARELA